MDWIKQLADNFFSVPGEHALVIGTTGTGKTQCLYYILSGIRKYSPYEVIVWLDCGKSSEILKLVDWGDVLIHYPINQKIELNFKDESYRERFTFHTFGSPGEIWRRIEKDKINVISIEPFYSDPELFSEMISELFKALIRDARDLTLKDLGLVPMTIIIDEIQWLIPNDKEALSRKHLIGARWFQRNIEMLRSMRVRVVGASQNWTKMRSGVRDSFSWLWMKRGARFSIDRPYLFKHNKKFQQLRDDEVMIARPDQIFSSPIELQFFGRGEKIGTVYYKPIWEKISEMDEIVSGYG